MLSSESSWAMADFCEDVIWQEGVKRLQTRIRSGVDGWEEDGGNLPLASLFCEAASSYWASYPSLHKPLNGLRVVKADLIPSSLEREPQQSDGVVGRRPGGIQWVPRVWSGLTKPTRGACRGGFQFGYTT
ncbi:jg13718 [Pararge aegeria aegeria]|uniref:Jg13718 protein n=1 Tax=Pararge aegeria aegeria TaxID=348720 RepID=A0A8S4RP37_9NEOP|nr:jg13718 [Pararge aegeria aegeria]